MYLDIDRQMYYNIAILGERAFIKSRRPQEGSGRMAEKTAAQKRAQKAYMEKFAVARVRMDREQYGRVQAHAEAQGESVNGFINRAISEAMERDTAPHKAAGGPG